MTAVPCGARAANSPAVIIILQSDKNPKLIPVCDSQEQEIQLAPLVERARKMLEVA